VLTVFTSFDDDKFELIFRNSLRKSNMAQMEDSGPSLQLLLYDLMLENYFIVYCYQWWAPTAWKI